MSLLCCREGSDLEKMGYSASSLTTYKWIHNSGIKTKVSQESWCHSVSANGIGGKNHGSFAAEK